MKIWTIMINDDNSGFEPEIHFTKKAADRAAWDWVLGAWTKWFGNPDAPPNWQEAAEKLYEQAGFLDSITLTEHDISYHPAASQARGALNNCVDQMNLLADLANCDDDDVADARLDVETALEMLK